MMDLNTVDATPTKDFFISMLVRDIDLIDAIADLVDNSIDGARRNRKDGNYEGLHVCLDLSHEQFRIADNCGGMSVEIARSYAFKFGRPEKTIGVEGSIGRFGVGMKRSFFKLGQAFRVQSATVDTYFVLEDSVDEWRTRDQWTFDFLERIEPPDPIPKGEPGTDIVVTRLHPEVARDISSERFVSRLIDDLASKHGPAIGGGLSISVNSFPVLAAALGLKQSKELVPAFVELSYGNTDDSTIVVKLYVGIDEPDPNAAGWYVFCNGRLILKADQSNDTGWKEAAAENDQESVPQYHNNYARFRGFAFFEARNPDLLPWNTTKTGVDMDSPVYRSVRQKMITKMVPVIRFLYGLAKERAQFASPSDRLIEQAVNKSPSHKLSDITGASVFVRPDVTRAKKPTTQRVQYSKDVSEIDLVKASLGVTSLKDVGEKTFEYYLRMECSD